MIQDNGQIPILLMPLNDIDPVNGPIFNLADASTQVAELVKAVNVKLTSTPKPGGGFYEAVTHWLYPNEPNLKSGSHPQFQVSDIAEKIHDYTKAFYEAIYGPGNTCWNSAWGTPIFIGPELAGFDDYPHYASDGNLIYDDLIDQLCDPTSNYINSKCILPYVSWFTFHFYPFGDESEVYNGVYDDGYFLEAKRQNVIDVLRNRIDRANGSPQPASFVENLDKLLAPSSGLIEAYNSTSGRNVKVAITEANICHINDVNGDNSFTGAISPEGNSANSFIAGQFYSELITVAAEYNVGLNFWSSIEGCLSCSIPDYGSDIGFLQKNPSAPGGEGEKKSTYHHFQKTAEYFKGNTLAATTKSSTTTVGDIKVAACINSSGGVNLILINQVTNTAKLQTEKTTFTVDLANGGSGDFSVDANLISGGNPIQVTFSVTNEGTAWVELNSTGGLVQRCDYSLYGEMVDDVTYTYNVGNSPTCFNGLTATAAVIPNCPGYVLGEISVNALNGTPPYTYVWSPAVSTTSTGSNLPAGVYNIIVTDASPTPQSFPISVKITDLGLSTTVAGANVTLIAPGVYSAGGAGEVTITAVPSKPGAYSFSWERIVTDFVSGTSVTYALGSTQAITTDCDGGGIFKVTMISSLPVCTLSAQVELFAPICGTPTDCSNTGVDVVSAMSTMKISYTKSISGSILVSSGGELVIENSEVKFSPGSSIKVMPGGKIKIINSQLYGCGLQQWQGLIIHGNSRDTDQVRIFGSLIRDAIQPILLEKVKGVRIEKSDIVGGIASVELNRSEDFILKGNRFLVGQNGVKTYGSAEGTGSLISDNFISSSINGLIFSEDNHKNLEISCNKFFYKDYAVYSTNTLLNDQGSVQSGAGNHFNSSSQLNNHKLYHSGNSLKYFYDPSVPVSPNEMAATIAVSQGDATCGVEIALRENVLDNLKQHQHFVIQPNPNSGSMLLSYSLGEFNQGKIQLYSLSGILINEYLLSSENNSLIISQDNLESGVYLIQMNLNDEVIISEKLVIVK